MCLHPWFSPLPRAQTAGGTAIIRIILTIKMRSSVAIIIVIHVSYAIWSNLIPLISPKVSVDLCLDSWQTNKNVFEGGSLTLYTKG